MRYMAGSRRSAGRRTVTLAALATATVWLIGWYANAVHGVDTVGHRLAALYDRIHPPLGPDLSMSTPLRVAFYQDTRLQQTSTISKLSERLVKRALWHTLGEIDMIQLASTAARFSSDNSTEAQQSSLERIPLHNFDVLILTNADRELHRVLSDDVLDQVVPTTRILAVVHDSRSYSRTWQPRIRVPVAAAHIGEETRLDTQTLQRMAHFIEEDRLSFIVQSPHVGQSLNVTLHDSLPTLHSHHLRIENFVPIFPVAPQQRRNSSAVVRDVLIVGDLRPSFTAFDRILAAFKREMAQHSVLYGYRRQKKIFERVGSNTSLVITATPMNTLSARPHVPPDLVNAVILDPPFNANTESWVTLDLEPHLHGSAVTFPRALWSTDVVLPAFADVEANTRYTASPTLPLAVMARIPALLSLNEAAAYAYLETPAVLKRIAEEDEFAALTRMRYSLYATSIWSDDASWERYQGHLFSGNVKALKSLLKRPKMP